MFFGSGRDSSWAAFAGAHPDYRIASAPPFVISDVQTGGQIIVRDVSATKS